MIKYKILFLIVLFIMTMNSCRNRESVNISSPKIQKLIKKQYIYPKNTLDRYSKLLDKNQSNRLIDALESKNENVLLTLMLEDNILYLRIKKFSSNIDLLVRQSILKYQNNTKGIMLDLRDNPGGLLLKAIKISDYFIDRGVMLKTIGKNMQDSSTYYADKENTISSVPVVIIVNKNSISASEVLAGIMQDNKRATLVGQKTFGKTSIQDIIPVENDKILKITTERYYFASGKSIEGAGLLPDIEIRNKKIVIHTDIKSSQRYTIMNLKSQNKEYELLISKILLLD